MNRLYAQAEELYQDSGDQELNPNVEFPVFPPDEANLITSALGPPSENPKLNKHAPAIDLDFPARLVPSSTEGHFHLFIDKALTWEQYVALLAGFRQAGLIQEYWHRCALKRGFTTLRHNTTKQQEKAGGS